MKSVTEFPIFSLNQGLKAKADLTAEGKSAEDIQASIGTTFKYEGDKLKHFMNALEVAGTNLERLKRVVVVSLAEGENAPGKAVKMDESHYVPEFLVDPKAVVRQAEDSKGGRGGKGRGGPGRGGDSKKGTPWGLSPEEKAAKKGAGAAKAAKA